VTAPHFQLRVHKYEEDRDGGTRTLIEYTPFLRLGAPSSSGHSGEVVYLQRGHVYGEGGDVYEVEDLPAWFPDALGALTPKARHDVGFTADRVQWYTGGRLTYDVSPPSGSTGEVTPVGLPADPYPPGFKPDYWILGWLCKAGHDYQRTGKSRYDKSWRCVDCTNITRAGQKKKAKAKAREPSSG
jgi:hypothetical protein